MFVRIKQIKGKPYGYLVENEWTKRGSRQKVVAYLGRVHVGEEKPPGSFLDVSEENLLQAVAEYEVSEHVQVDVSTCSVQKEGKEVVLEINGGLLCSQTLQRLRKALFTRNEARPGLLLATALRNAGLRLNQQDFIRLYIHYQV